MPLIKRGEDGAAERTAREMRRTADLLDALARVKPTARQKARARAHPEMERIARRFAISALPMAMKLLAGSVSAAQLRSMASNFIAIGKALIP